MCGITGLFDPTHSLSTDSMEHILKRMTQSLAHRGPDADGHWLLAQQGLALGHRRLSIRDLSPAGAQPMLMPYAQNEYNCIVYNGEIYNAEELRDDLHAAGYSFSGTSDTEVVLKGCAHYGIEAFVPRMIGMFGFAFWDTKQKRLSIVRDRLGIKPIYYTKLNSIWGFASELKALHFHPHWKKEIDRNAIAQFLRYGYIHAPHSIFENVYKLMPGTMLHINNDGKSQIHTYWDAKEKMLAGQKNTYVESENVLVEMTHNLLKDAVKRRMVADVPLGAFLSGGIDSSLVAALMQSQSIEKIRTFSIGFDETSYDEAPFAKAIAERLGTDHTEHYMEPKDAWDVIPQLDAMYDEPFADSSQLPTYLLSAMTRQHVTVALSGDGGDELFAGYGRYFYLDENSTLTTPFWKMIHHTLKYTPESLLTFIAKLGPSRYRHDFIGRLHRLVERHYVDYLGLYKRVCMTHWQAPEDIVISGKEPKDIFDDRDFLESLSPRISQMQAADTLQYLCDDILVKVDRASMATSLEVRVPILDHRVFEHAWKLPMKLKAQNKVGKLVLRKILGDYVPNHLFERPKMGFGVPIDIWLRAPLRDWAEDLLDEKRMREDGFLHPAPIREAWKRHLQGEDFAYPIWDILMLQGFLRN